MWVYAVILAVGAFIVATSSWKIRNYNLSVKQRIEIIRAIPPGDPDGLLDDYDAVTYDDHVRELIMFRDPMNLYSDKLLTVVQEARKINEI